MKFIHPSAIVESDAKIGENVRIGPFSYISSQVEIEDNCDIGSHVVVLPFVKIGNGCKIHSGAVIGDLPQDLAYKGARSFVNIGPNCIIREGVTIHRGTTEDTVTEVGEGCFLMAFSHIAHNCKIGKRVIIANGSLLAGYVEVGDNVFISGNCLVHQFVHIGKFAMLGGGCAVSQDVPPFVTIKPLTANTILGINVVGLKRAGFSEEERIRIKRAYKVLFLSGLRIQEALGRLKEEEKYSYIKDICDFIRNSHRGVCRFGIDIEGE